MKSLLVNLSLYLLQCSNSEYWHVPICTAPLQVQNCKAERHASCFLPLAGRCLPSCKAAWDNTYESSARNKGWDSPLTLYVSFVPLRDDLTFGQDSANQLLFIFNISCSFLTSPSGLKVPSKRDQFGAFCFLFSLFALFFFFLHLKNKTSNIQRDSTGLGPNWPRGRYQHSTEPGRALMAVVRAPGSGP